MEGSVVDRSGLPGPTRSTLRSLEKARVHTLFSFELKTIKDRRRQQRRYAVAGLIARQPVTRGGIKTYADGGFVHHASGAGIVLPVLNLAIRE